MTCITKQILATGIQQGFPYSRFPQINSSSRLLLFSFCLHFVLLHSGLFFFKPNILFLADTAWGLVSVLLNLPSLLFVPSLERLIRLITLWLRQSPARQSWKLAHQSVDLLPYLSCVSSFLSILCLLYYL